MTDFSADKSTPATNSPQPFAPVSPRREDTSPPFGSGSGSSGSSGSSLGGGSTGGTSGSSPSPGTSSSATAPSAPNGGQRSMPEVKGRIEVADEVVEKVAGLAATEVPGVADLGGDIERALESVRDRIGIGNKRGDQGIKARITGREVTIDVTIMIQYGHVVMDVARNVKLNVARQTNRMLGLNVVEVNVTVDDIKMPETERKDDRDNDGDGILSYEG
ncbi:MAG: Asp23/Gls24 family envelope stress response protein [Acidimicrobiales bacterium]